LIFLLDASVLINAHQRYYSFDAVPQFWPWLVYMGSEGKVKIVQEVYDEIVSNQDKDKDKNIKDHLSVWAKEEETKKALLFAEEVDVALVQKVTNVGYAPDLTDIEIEKIGRDPFLIAHALKDNGNRVIVTDETPRPNKKRANRKIPNVCDDFSIKNINSFRFFKDLNFSTNWEAKLKTPTET